MNKNQLALLTINTTILHNRPYSSKNKAFTESYVGIFNAPYQLLRYIVWHITLFKTYIKSKPILCLTMQYLTFPFNPLGRIIICKESIHLAIIKNRPWL